MAQNFAKEVKKSLIDRDWTASDLAQEVNRKTGLYCDAAYISRILTGKRKGAKIAQAISEILDIRETEETNAGRTETRL